jgi:hypothetical protein
MNSQLKVENAIERSLGKAGGTGDERFEIRFWLSTEINGRKAESRGTVVTIEKPTVADAQDFARRIGYSVAAKIFDNQWTAKDARVANATLAEFVNDAIKADAELDAAFNSFAK